VGGRLKQTDQLSSEGVYSIGSCSQIVVSEAIATAEEPAVCSLTNTHHVFFSGYLVAIYCYLTRKAAEAGF
jgi:hypothetical protein